MIFSYNTRFQYLFICKHKPVDCNNIPNLVQINISHVFHVFLIFHFQICYQNYYNCQSHCYCSLLLFRKLHQYHHKTTKWDISLWYFKNFCENPSLIFLFIDRHWLLAKNFYVRLVKNYSKTNFFLLVFCNSV